MSPGPYTRCRKCNDELQRDEGMYRRLMTLASDNRVFRSLAQRWREQPDRSTLDWVRKHWDLLEACVYTDFSREALLKLPFSIQSINGLCFYLEQANLMKPIVVDVDRLVHRVRAVVADIERRDALVLEEYARMILARRAQRRADYGERSDPQMNSQLRAIRLLARFSKLVVAGSSGARSLVTMTQTDLRKSKGDPDTSTSLWDHCPSYSDRTFLGAFLRWHNKQRPMLARLRIPKSGSPWTPKVLISNEEMSDLKEKALTEIWPVKVRLAALLMMLYRQPTDKIRALHVTQLQDECKKIRFTDVWINLPDPLPELFRQQLASRGNQDSPWVFPSRIYRGLRPMTRNSLQESIQSAGFPIRRALGGAMVSLLRVVEYPLLARILGMDVQTAATWAQLVGSPSEDQYILMRRKQDREQPKTVTIADRVYAQYRGDELVGDLSPSSPAVFQDPLPDEEFEARFTIRRVAVQEVIAKPLMDQQSANL